MRTITALVLLLVAASARSAACDNFFGQRCRVTLPTGVHMSYFERGPAGGEVLILLHTDTTSAVEWAWTADALTALDPALHLYALDQRGTGDTSLPDTATCWSKPNLCMTNEAQSGDVLAFMDARHIGRATLVGHGMGAAVARHAALTHPARLTRLILSGTGLPSPPPARPPVPGSGMEALGWQHMLEARGVQWPQGALHMRPLDIDPDAVRHIIEHWDISVIAQPEVVERISAESAMQWLASWGRLDPTPLPRSEPDALETLAVPVLVLWGAGDVYYDRHSQERLIEVLRTASRTHPGMDFYWKQYGVRGPAPSKDKHQADDIGHDVSWEAPQALAADIESFVRHGRPTRDRCRTDYPRDIHSIVTDPGQAEIVSSRP